MKTTVALVESPGSRSRWPRSTWRAPCGRGAGAHRRHRRSATPTSPSAASCRRRCSPTCSATKGRAWSRQVGADVTGHRGRRPRRHVPALLPRVRRSARPETWVTASRALLHQLHGHADGRLHDVLPRRQPVFGSFFGQSSFSQHAIAYADNCVVVDKSLDLARPGRRTAAGFQTGVGNDAQRREPHSRPERGRLRGRVGRPGRHLGRPHYSARRSSRSTRWRAGGSSRRRTAPSTIDPDDLGDVTIVDKVKELTGGGATYAIDTTAIGEVVKAAAAVAGRQGHAHRHRPGRRGVR